MKVTKLWKSIYYGNIMSEIIYPKYHYDRIGLMKLSLRDEE